MDYELLDFGAGRKLERFAAFILDRPSPSAEGFTVQNLKQWKSADAKFIADSPKAERGRWIFHNQNLSPDYAWPISFSPSPITLELKFSPFGHLGVFPEQQVNWRRIAERISDETKRAEPLRVLNLFAYTGGSTLAAAAAGAKVVHIDSAKNLLARARRNAELSGLADTPIRWIAEDAVRFVQREIKRDEKYDAVILDPPSYGHGSSGQVWQISRDLPGLLHNCFELLSEKPIFLLLTCHTPFFDEKRLLELLRQKNFTAKSFPMEIPSSNGNKLSSGCGVIVSAKKPIQNGFSGESLILPGTHRQ